MILLDNNDDDYDSYDYYDDDDDQATDQLDPAFHRFPCRAWSSGGEPPDPLELRFPPLWNFLLTFYDVFYGVSGWALIGFPVVENVYAQSLLDRVFAPWVMSLKILQFALFFVTLDNKADLEKDGKCEVNFSRPFIKISGTPPGAKPLKISPLPM